MCSNLNDYKLKVVITHFVPPPLSARRFLRDFFVRRLTVAWLRSWARLFKYGTRGNQPWKIDIMTFPRRSRDKFREEYLAQVVKNLESLGFESVDVHIFSNREFTYEKIKNSTNLYTHVFEIYNEMNVLNNSPWLEDEKRNPWNLLWEHKSLLKEFVREKKEDKVLYLVTDNDLLIGRENFEYWITNRERLRQGGFLPSYILAEYSQNSNSWLCPSIHKKYDIDISKWSSITIAGIEYLSIPSLYAGFFIMDDQLLAEYVQSEAIDPILSKSLTWWDKGARSAMGLQFVNVPSGFSDRYLIRLLDDDLDFEMGSLVHHLPNLYASVPEVSQNFPSISALKTFSSIVDKLKRRVE